MTNDTGFYFVAHYICRYRHVYYSGHGYGQRAYVKINRYTVRSAVCVPVYDSNVHRLVYQIFVIFVIYIQVEVIHSKLIESKRRLVGIGIVFKAHESFCSDGEPLQSFNEFPFECEIHIYYFAVLFKVLPRLRKRVRICEKYNIRFPDHILSDSVLLRLIAVFYLKIT